MTFFGLSPWAVFGVLALAAAALFLLHYLKVRPQVTRVPTLLFWREAAEETRARSLFDRFRHPRTFLLLLALLGALIFALADPRTAGDEAATRHYALLVDSSPSLGVAGSEDSGDIREEILASVRETLRGISLRDRVAVFTPDLVADFDDARGLAVERLADLPEAAPCDWDALVARARSRLAGRSRPRLIAFTGPDTPAVLAGATGADDPVRVDVVRHGRRPIDRGLGAVVFDDTLRVEVTSNAAAPARRLIARGAGGETLGSVDVPAANGAERTWVAVPNIPANGTELTLTLEPADRVAGNDRVRYLRPSRRVVRVHVAFDSPVADALVDADPLLERAPDAKSANVVVAHGKEGEALAARTVIAEVRRPGFRDAVAPSSFPALFGTQRGIAGRPAASVLLTAGRWPVAQSIAAGGAPDRVAVLEVASFLFDPTERFCRSAAGAAWLAEAIRTAAGERPGQVLVAPRAAVSIIDDRRRESSAMPRGLVASGAEAFARHAGGAVGPPSEAVESRPARVGSGGFRAWEWLVLLGLMVACVDLWLQLRGRIP